jgi:hypothetical protein
MMFGPETTVYYLAVDLGYDFCNGFTPGGCGGSNDMQNKWPKYANTRLGLSFSFDSDCLVTGGHYYSTIKSQLNADKPMSMAVTYYSWSSSGGPYTLQGGHVVAIVAYDENHWVGGDPIGVYINGNGTYNTVWWNYAQIRAQNDEITMTITSGGSPGTFLSAPSSANPSGNSNVCAGNISFSWQNVGASSYRVQVSSTSNFSSYLYDFTTTSTSATKSITTSGTYYWRVMPRNSSNNWCHFNDNTFIFKVIQTPVTPGAISGNTPVCQGTTNPYSIASVSGATFYTWTLPSGWSGSSTSTSINATAGSSGGTISVIANNSCGSSAAQTKSISVNSVPLQPSPISGSTPICQSTTNPYSIPSVTGATSYTWTLPSGWSGSSSTTLINATAGSSGGLISVTANNTCGVSPATSKSVTVNPLPAQPGPISGNTPVCQNSPNTYSISSVAEATSYTWTLPSGWSGSSSTASINATAGSNGGTLYVKANNSCGSGPQQSKTITVNTTPSQPGAISGTTSVCQGSSNTYTIISVAGATSYTWSLPAGWSGSSNTTSISTTAGTGGGLISVTANNDCGISSPRSVSADVTPGQFTLSGQVVGNSQNRCDDACQTVTIAGSGSTFVVQSGGNSTVIAGQKILLLPGVRVYSGGYFHGYIAPTGPWCSSTNNLDNQIQGEAKDFNAPIAEIQKGGELHFRLYPNPTSGNFKLELKEEPTGSIVTVKIYSMMGAEIMEQSITSGRIHELSLSDQQPGVYLVRVIRDGLTGVKKIVRQ